MTDGDEAGKLFVGGLSWETSKDNLQHYFSQYGEVVDSVVMKNPATGRSRGFGFVTFKDSNCVSLVLQSGPHELDGRTIDPKACTPKSEQQKGRRDDGSPKLFLGGLPADVTETEIRSAFMEFGRVTDVVIMYDQEKKKSRGFGFLSYDSEDGVEQACAQRFVTVNGKQVECKRAEPRSASRRGGRTDNQWSSNGMGGQSRSWGSGVGSLSQNLGTGAASGAMANGYQSWGSQVLQAPYPQQSSYSTGYQSWNSSSGYGNAPPTYGQPSYSGYGVPSSYNLAQGAGAPAASDVASDPVSSTASTTPATMNPPSQSTDPYGYGSSTSGYGSYGDTSKPNRNQSAGQQSYHPYRR